MADWWTGVYIINMYLQFIYLQNTQTYDDKLGQT